MSDPLPPLVGLLDSLDLSEERILDDLGLDSMVALLSLTNDGVEQRTEPLGARGVLLRVVVFGLPAAAEHLPYRDELVAAGLVEVSGSRAVPKVRFNAFGGMLLASDVPASAPDGVCGVTVSSMALALLTIRDDVDRVLDLGTGNGVQALLASAHARRVVGVDVNARALAYAELNRALSGASNVAWCVGDFLDPFSDGSFDLLVSNPPFAITPENRHLYRDNRFPQDELARRLVSEAPRVLRDGGHAQILLDHALVAGEKDRLRSWIGATGCTAVVVDVDTVDVDSYVELWIHPDERGDAGVERRWRTYFAGLGIESVSTSLVTVRRDGGPVTFVDAPSRWLGGCGHHITRILDAAPVAARPDDAILDARLVRAPDVELQRAVAANAPDPGRLVMRAGFARTANLDEGMFELVVALDGRVLRDAVALVADRHRLDFGRCAMVALGCVRDLLKTGFLVEA